MERQEREKLRQEWVEQQEKIKSKSLQLLPLLKYTSMSLCICIDEDIEITYSYWDGSGHRRHITVSEEATVAKQGLKYMYALCLDEEGPHYSSISA